MNTYYLYNQKKNVVEIAINFIKNGDKEENALVIMWNEEEIEHKMNIQIATWLKR